MKQFQPQVTAITQVSLSLSLSLSLSHTHTHTHTVYSTSFLSYFTSGDQHLWLRKETLGPTIFYLSSFFPTSSFLGFMTEGASSRSWFSCSPASVPLSATGCLCVTGASHRQCWLACSSGPFLAGSNWPHHSRFFPTSAPRRADGSLLGGKCTGITGRLKEACRLNKGAFDSEMWYNMIMSMLIMNQYSDFQQTATAPKESKSSISSIAYLYVCVCVYNFVLSLRQTQIHI